MRFYKYDIVFQEVPDEISICFTITGCKLRCPGCHSAHLWKDTNGEILTDEVFQSILSKYKNLASCVLFMGGEWDENRLIELLQYAKSQNFATCLYTGEEDVSNEIKSELTYLKTGRWTSELGGLKSKTTNQKFIRINDNQILNYKFMI